MQPTVCGQPLAITFAATFGDGAAGYAPDNCDSVHDECHGIWEADKHGEARPARQRPYEALERRARSIIRFGSFEQAQKLKELQHGKILQDAP
jgi:hypothetical protein